MNQDEFNKVSRKRRDNTAIHKTAELSASPSVETIKLDIVAKKVSVQLESGLTATADGAIDGAQWFTLGSFSSGRLTYGNGASDHLVKWVRITRSAGSGKALVLAL